MTGQWLVQILSDVSDRYLCRRELLDHLFKDLLWRGMLQNVKNFMKMINNNPICNFIFSSNWSKLWYGWWLLLLVSYPSLILVKLFHSPKNPLSILFANSFRLNIQAELQRRFFEDFRGGPLILNSWFFCYFWGKWQANLHGVV